MKIIFSKESYKWLPFKVIKFYVLGLLFLSIFGPVRYGYGVWDALVVTIYILAFLLFTWVGMAKASTYTTAYYASLKNEANILLILKLSILVTFPIKIMLLISSVRLMGMPLISNIFTMLATVYTEMHNGEAVSNIYRQIDTFTTFIFYFSTFVGLFWRKKVGRLYTMLIAVNVLLDLIYQLCFIGTQRSIITIAVVVLTLFATNAVNSNYRIDKRKLRKAMLIGIGLLVVFMNILSARKNLWNGGTGYVYKKSNYDFNNWFLIWCGNDKLKYDVTNLTSYFTQGFYGLSLAFKVPFQWTYFLGGVRGLNSIISQVFKFVPDMVEFTYPVRAGTQFAFDGLASWYTIFPWLASDFTFVGALIYMSVVGWLFMRCWIQSIKYDNPIAFLMLVLLVIQYIFVVANNQLFVQRGESFATVVILIIYFVYNKRFNFNKNED